MTVRASVPFFCVNDLGDAVLAALKVEAAEAPDVAITMGCGDAYPVFPGKRYLDRELADPAGRPIEEVQGIRDFVDRRVAGLVAELTG